MSGRQAQLSLGLLAPTRKPYKMVPDTAQSFAPCHRASTFACRLRLPLGG